MFFGYFSAVIKPFGEWRVEVFWCFIRQGFFFDFLDGATFPWRPLAVSRFLCLFVCVCDGVCVRGPINQAIKEGPVFGENNDDDDDCGVRSKGFDLRVSLPFNRPKQSSQQQRRGGQGAISVLMCAGVL